MDVWAIHGIDGTWGILATGLFVGSGFMNLSDVVLPGIDRDEQILRQVVSRGVSWGWALGMTIVILLALKYTISIRVSEDDEQRGLDFSLHGKEAYST